MPIDRYFSQSYHEARAKFRAAAAHAKIDVESYVHDSARAPDGSELSTDVALFGARDASNLLVLLSGVHGIEGYAGSGCQVALIERVRFVALPMDTAVLVVHALDPWGFAWDRRANEHNVDINCNAIDHNVRPAPAAHYAALHPHLTPADWSGPNRAVAERAITAFIAEHGEQTYLQALAAGQYEQPAGLGYGGTMLEWSTRTFLAIMKRWAIGKNHIALIDFHSGPALPEHGGGVHIHTGADGAAQARAQVWFGKRTTAEESSACLPERGALIEAAAWVNPQAERTPIQCRFGTVPWMQMQECWRAEHWAHVYGRADSQEGRQIKRAFRECFYVDDGGWRSRAVHHAEDVVGQALGGLSL